MYTKVPISGRYTTHHVLRADHMAATPCSLKYLGGVTVENVAISLLFSAKPLVSRAEPKSSQAKLTAYSTVIVRAAPDQLEPFRNAIYGSIMGCGIQPHTTQGN